MVLSLFLMPIWIISLWLFHRKLAETFYLTYEMQPIIAKIIGDEHTIYNSPMGKKNDIDQPTDEFNLIKLILHL